MDGLTLFEAALIAHCKPVSLRAAIKRGDLKAHKAGPRTWIVARKDLDMWINNAEMHRRGAKKRNPARE